MSIFMNLELEELGKHGITLPPNMQGLTEEQISDLKLHDSWADKCVPSGGSKEVKDPMSKRNGQGRIVDKKILVWLLWC